MKEVKWNDRFNLGVDVIDQAHQRLFSIVGKLLALNEDSEKQRHACKEGIKYFKSYTLKHFAEEERYMQSINYGGFAMHKKLHDNLRTKTLPALEDELVEHDYSVESVQHFLGIFVGWLDGHIMIEDRAITGKNPNKWVHQPSEDITVSLIRAIKQSLQVLCQADAQLVSQLYGGEDFASGHVLCYRLSYSSKGKQNKKYQQVFLAYEESLILRTLGEILDLQLNRVDKTVVDAMKIISEEFMGYLRQFFVLDTKYILDRNDMQTFDQFVRNFDKEYPPYSLLFNAHGKGYFAFCVKP